MTAPLPPPPAGVLSHSTVVVLDGAAPLSLVLPGRDLESGGIRIGGLGSAVNICCTDVAAARHLRDACVQLVDALEIAEGSPAAGRLRAVPRG